MSTEINENRPGLIVPQFRDRAGSLNTENPVVQNLWYDSLPVSSDALGLYWSFRQTNNGAAQEQIAYEAIVDGTTYGGTQLCNNNTIYYIYRNLQADNLLVDTNIRQMKYGRPYYGHSMHLRIRQTSGVDPAGSALEHWVVFEQL